MWVPVAERKRVSVVRLREDRVCWGMTVVGMNAYIESDVVDAGNEVEAGTKADGGEGNRNDRSRHARKEGEHLGKWRS